MVPMIRFATQLWTRGNVWIVYVGRQPVAVPPYEGWR